MEPSPRDEWFDALKGVLIFLVVYGHFLLGHFPAGSINCTVKNFLYLFHMPLFVFISGVFSHVRDKRKYIRSIIRLMETYLLFQLLHYLIPLPFDDGGITWLRYLVFPAWTLWYLLSLATWKIFVFLIGSETLAKRKRIVVILSFVLCFASGFIPLTTQFSFQRTLSFLPFFVCGYYCSPLDIKTFLRKIPAYIPLAVFICAIAGLYLLVGRDLGPITSGSADYYHMHDNPLVAGALRLCFMVCAALLSLSVMRLVPSSPFLADLGKHSLFIYILHPFIATVVFLSIRRWPVLGSTLSLFLLSAFTTYVLYLAAKTKLSLVLNPVSNLCRLKPSNIQ